MRILKKFPMYCLAMVLGLLLINKSAHAQTDKIEGTWYNDIKSAKIKITKDGNGKFNGHIVWLKVPEENGKPRTDIKNKDEKLKSRPLMGLPVLIGFDKDPDNENKYINGSIYSPTEGKVYTCKITYKGQTLDIRGYVLTPLFGRTTVWSRAD